MGMSRILRVISILKILVFISLIVFVPDVLSAGSKDRKDLATTLTNEFRDEGWPALQFEAVGQNYKTIRIEQKNVTQEEPLTEWQLTNVLGTILKPDIVKRLKTSGFEKGVFVDGRSRNYPFKVSRKYHDDMRNFFKSYFGVR